MSNQSVWEDWGADQMHPGGRETTLRLLQKAGLAFGARVAEIGAGTGDGVDFLLKRGLDAVGVDISMELCAIARERGVQALCADAGSLPFGNGELDGLLLECTLSALPDASAALKEFARVLKAGGALMVSDMRYQDAEQAKQVWKDMLSLSGFSLEFFEDCPGALEEFKGKWLWELAGTPMLRRLCETGCADAKGYFIMVAHLKGGG